MTRPYLRSDDRRRQLLAAAMAVIDARGLEGLTIANVAAEAGVTRQLVYRHFDDIGALLLALLADRFGEDRAHPAQAQADGRPPGLARSMAQRAMSRPAADRRLLRSVLAASDERRPELTRVIAALRADIIDRWIRLAPDEKTDPAARAWVWAVFNAQFGLWDLIDAGDIDPAQAADVLIRIIQDHFAAERPEVAAQAQQPDPLGLPHHPGVFSDRQLAAAARKQQPAEEEGHPALFLPGSDQALIASPAGTIASRTPASIFGPMNMAMHCWPTSLSMISRGGSDPRKPMRRHASAHGRPRG